jgi:hypothetical protein
MFPTPMLAVRRLTLLSCCMAGILPAAPARHQVDRLDIGSFTIFIKDARAGREQFSMQQTRTADGATLELRAESAIGDRRSAVRLEVDSAGTPVRYSVEQRTGSTVTLRLGGQRVRGRFATLARSTSGEAAREYLLAPGAQVLEDDGLLQYALLIRHRTLAVGEFRDIPVLTPIANRQGSVRLSLISTSDTVVVAGSRRVAHQWRVIAQGGEARFIWADAEGRLLRIQIPVRGFNALRDDVPR